MPLTTDVIKKQLSAAPSVQRDNEAQRLINSASDVELKDLDAEGVLRLYEALALLPPRIYSSNDAAAMKRLKTHTQFQLVKRTPDFGVDLVKNASAGFPLVQSLLTSDVVARIYHAEGTRLSFAERIGFDGDTIGRGQLGQPAYTDVRDPSYYKTAWEACVTHVYLSKALDAAPAHPYQFDFSTYTVQIPKDYGEVWRNPIFEDFVVAAYLAILIRRSTKSGRSPTDTLRIAVALYHGMRGMVVQAQTATNNEFDWAPVEAELLRAGRRDEVAYVNEVVR